MAGHGSASIAWVLAILAAIGPFSIDTYLPAFPAIATDLASDALGVQQTLTAYMLPFAFMSLWHGALSDSFGRQRVIVVAMGVFAFASLLCALAPSIGWLWFGRALQGLSAGAGMVVGRAVIRDLLDGAPAQRLMSRVMMIFGIAPALAPMVGGLLLQWGSWRGIFVFLALFGAVLMYLSWRALPETLPVDARQPFAAGTLWRNYRQVLGDRRFLLLAGAVGLNFNGFFIYVLSAPAFLLTHLQLRHTDFHWLFVPAVAGMMSGALLSGQLAGRLSQARTIGTGHALMTVAALANVYYTAQSAVVALPWAVLPIMLYTFGMALAMPSMTLIALERFPTLRGLSASCQSFLQVLTNALSAALLAPLAWASPHTLALAMLGFLGLGALCWQGGMRASAPAPI